MDQHEENAKQFFANANGIKTGKSKGTLHLPRKVLVEVVIPPVKDRGTAMSAAFRALYGKQQQEKGSENAAKPESNPRGIRDTNSRP